MKPLRRAAFPLLLFAVNCYFAKDLYSLEYSRYMGSIEAAYIAISRYMTANWRDLSWFPLWYGGIPFQNTYPPLLHASVALASVIASISPARAYHFMTALFYCLGPVALYALAVRLTKSRWCGFWSAWIYSILSPCLFLMPRVHADMGAMFGPRRFQALVFYGEGPHALALALLPVAILSLDHALSKRTPVWYAAAALSMAAVALSNWLGTLALAIAVFAYLLARSRTLADWKVWVQTIGLAALAYALACSWIPPSTIRDIRYNAQSVGGSFQYLALPLYAAVGFLIAILLKFTMQRARLSASLQFSLLFLVLIGAIPLGAEWFNVAIVPQPERYHLELDLALCLTLGLSFWKLQFPYKQAFAAALLLLSILPIRQDRRIARSMVKPIDIRDTLEYKTAKWFDSNAGGGRVMAAGSISYWLNAFTDTPQFGGGFDQGIVNRNYGAVQYQILSSEGAGPRAAEIAALWMRAYGVVAIAVHGPFMHPATFAESFRPAEGVVYWGLERDGSLAHVLPRDAVVRNQPLNGLDIVQTQVYVNALRPAKFRWTSRHSAEIQAGVPPGQVISIQITYHPGWRATANGRDCPLSRDGLGEMVAHPQCDGPCTLELSYDGGVEMKIARILSWSSSLGCLAWIVFYRRRR